jgi:hypothetical protein
VAGSSKGVPKGVQKRAKNGPWAQTRNSKKTKSEIVLRLERERFREGKIAFSLESQLDRENPFFMIFVEIVLRLQREHCLEGAKKTCLNKEREARLRFDFFLLTNSVLWMFFFARTKQQQ